MNQPSATFSVIIPAYNRRGYLLGCLESVAAQRHAPHEVIVVNDGSTDGTREAVEDMEGVQLIQQRNGGPGAARNRGAEVATADYLAFLDSDDLWFPWSLKAMAELIEQHGRPSLLFARFEDFSDTAPSGQSDQPAVGCAYPDFLAAAPEGCFAGAGMMVVARDAFRAAGGFAEGRINAEDHDLALRLGTAPGFVQVTAPVIVAHRVHGANEMGDVDRTLAGITRLVETEASGGYPGGAARRAARRSAIAHHVRPAVVSALRTGRVGAALDLYRQTFAWNARAGRVAFLLAVPLMGLRARLRPAPQARESG